MTLVATMPGVSTGHTPYQQWGVYRKRHLLILTNRTDSDSYPIGKRVAEVLATYLPTSNARVTRAPHRERIASLISTKQLDVALLRRDEARALFEGRTPFAEFGPVRLRTLTGLGKHLLVSRDDFPAEHAYLVAQALSLHHTELPVSLSRQTKHMEVPLHPGALAYYQGLPAPGNDASG